MNIKMINNQDRPREKLLAKGKEALGDAELLAILIDSGTKELSAIELANLILQKYSLSELTYISYEELKEFPGIKMAKATKIMAAFELARRAVRIEKEQIFLTNAKAIYSLMQEDLFYLKHEKIFLLLIDSKCRLIKKLTIADGDIAAVSLNYLKIIELFLKYKAYALFLVHNHPSGDAKPSVSDKAATADLKRNLNNLGINLVDHIIVTKDSYFSFLENNLLEDY